MKTSAMQGASRAVIVALLRRCAALSLLAPSIAMADCSDSTSGVTGRTCSGVVIVPDEYVLGTNIPGEDTILYVLEDLSGDILNANAFQPAFKFDVTRPFSSTPGTSGLFVNLTNPISLTIQSQPVSVFEVQEAGVGGGFGNPSSGSGNRSGGAGGDGASIGESQGRFNLATISIPDGTPDPTFLPTISISRSPGDGGTGGEGKSSGFGDGYGGRGGTGGSNGGYDLELADVSIAAPDGGSGSGQPNPYGGLAVTLKGGDGGTGGYGQAADYTGGGGNGGTGGNGSTSTLLTLEGDITIDTALFGLSVTSQGGDGGAGGRGHNTLTQTARGGQGGAGGSGGPVTVTAPSGTTIVVDVLDGPGLFVESLAGKGGRGGDASTSSVGGSAFGGGGGIGGAGGTVTVTLSADASDIQTTGDSAPGLHLRSHGGAGGDGGNANGTTAIGGGTRGAGPGGAVDLTFSGSVSTTGAESDAVFAHSVGGFSGDAGNASGWVAYGSDTQSAGSGGSVQVIHNGSSTDMISTSGDYSDGIFAQSVGGGGGKGTSAKGIEALSGAGASGGFGASVSVDAATGSIVTSGERSRAIVAQSIGGAGGDSGSAKGVVSIGGTGAAGGGGGEVSVTNNALITTRGADAIGILAQSVGGGGGSASSTGGLEAFGGAAANGATGGKVSVSHYAGIDTAGQMADAIFAQSIGGSGGHGANSVAAGTLFTLSISGKGGTGGHGSDVLVDTDPDSDLKTEGDNARGIVATSTGGGGGHAGSAVSASGFPIDVAIGIGADGGSAGDGGEVTTVVLGDISTSGANAIGVMATSIGGSGGSAATTVDASAGLGTVGVGVGGSGSGGGDGGAVTVCRGIGSGEFEIADCDKGTVPGGTITTDGDAATAVYAASVGGGGGHSGTTVSASVGVGADVSVGGDGGGGGTGADVAVYSSGGITTTGAAAAALVGKSVGGNGGAAYLTGAIDAFSTADSTVSVGGTGGASGGSGAVTVVSSDTIETSGDQSAGIIGLSQAGSGGTGGMSLAMTGLTTAGVNVAVGGAGGAGGTSGNARVEFSGSSLTTTGDQSAGIIAQSSGGSGGVGGITASGQGVGLASVGVALGGAGGAGGTAGEVKVISSGSIATAGTMSDAIFALSQGGNGGRGGTSITGDAISQGSAEVTIGGGGGNAGTATDVSVAQGTGATITTSGSTSAGIRAKSIGGNGGAGGVAVETGLNLAFSSGYPAGNASVTIGGSGGVGGASGAATVTNDSGIATSNYNSAGIVAQSIAGAGGSGGMSIAGTANIGAAKNVDVGVTLGGAGGTGGTAGNVSVTNAANGVIQTTGEASDGVLAQSVGGNGGAGGGSYNLLANVASGGTFSGNIGVSIGGGGGGGGQAGDVSVSNLKSVMTSGTESTGLYAQSVGGSGGKGGGGGNLLFNLGPQATGVDNTTNHALTIDVAVGGAGGDGAVGGDVSVTNAQSAGVATSGATAYGIFAQSVGGNGGDGGSASNFGFTLNGYCNIDYVNAQSACQETDPQTGKSKYANYKSTLKIAVGGGGGTGNHAGAARVTNDGVVQTSGENAHGIFAQSVGGSGGTGGSTLSTPLTPWGAYSSTSTGNQIEEIAFKIYQIGTAARKLWSGGSLSLFIGGKGGAAGDGGDVSVTGTGNVGTAGKNANAIHAQSVGGGGGAGGATNQKMAAYALRIGGSGNGGGNGGSVDVSIGENSIAATEGDGAAAIFAQSVGAGGGNAGGHFDLGSAYLMNLQIGGSDGVSGNGGVVSVTTATDASVLTGGREASGVVAQSVGGGGGQHNGGGDQATGTITVGGALTGTVTGNGGDVAVTSNGRITTALTHASGDENSYTTASHGIFAQSVGGGGGYGGSVLISNADRLGSGLTGQTAGATGNGGNVVVKTFGDVVTYGRGSMGIFAQAVGGGGGVQGDVNTSSTDAAYVGSFGGQGSAGTVAVAVEAGGSVTTTGDLAHGIFAQTAGGDGSGRAGNDTTTVTVDGSVSAAGKDTWGIYAQSSGQDAGSVSISVGADGSVSGETGIYVDAATTGSLTNDGTIGASSGAAGTAVQSAGGLLSITNNGTLTGSITGTTAIVNGGTLVAGDRLDATRLVNSGSLHVNDAGAVGPTRLTGDFVNTSSGVLRVDIDSDVAASDHLEILGNARLDGQIAISIQGAGGMQSGDFEIVRSNGTLDAADLDIRQSVAATHDLIFDGSRRLRLTYDIDFDHDLTRAQLTRNHAALATHIDDSYRQGALPTDLAGRLLASEDTAAYSALLEPLGAGLSLSNEIHGLSQATRFTDGLFSCPDRSGTTRYFDDGQCYYLRATGQRLKRDATASLDGFSANTFSLAGGVQLRADSGLVYGGSLSWDMTSLNLDNTASESDGHQFHVGVSIKHFIGQWELGAGASLGYGRFDNTRAIGPGVQAEGTQDQLTYGLQVRAAHLLDFDSWYAKPTLAVGLSGIDGSSYTETGSSGTELAVSGKTQTFFYLRPELEVGGDIEVSDDTVIRPKLNLAVNQILGDNSLSTSARFASAPAGVAPFDWTTDLDRTRFEVSAGVDVFTSGNTTFSLGGFGSFSDTTRNYGATANLSIRF